MLASPENDLFHFLSILESIGKIQLYIHGINSPEEFFEKEDQMVYNAVLTLLTNIGETIGKISTESQQLFQKNDLKNIKGLRNRIAHNYTGIDSFVIYDISTTKLESLSDELYEIFQKHIISGVFDQEEYTIAKTSSYYRHVDFNRLSTNR